MFGLNLLSPEKLIGLLKSNVEKQLDKKVTKFDLHFDVIKDTMFFFIEGVKYPFISETILPIIKGVIKTKAKKGVQLHYLLLRYSETEIFINIYYIEDEKQKFTKHIIK